MAATRTRTRHLSTVTTKTGPPTSPSTGWHGRSDPQRRAQTQELFTELHQTSDDAGRKALRKRLIEQNMGVAASIARRYYGRGERREDLDQVAYLGLTKAVAGFDPALDVDFLSYAVPTIAGEVKRHFRDRCWSVRPPRWVQEMQPKICQARERLTNELGREPSSRDIAAELNVAEDEVTEALSADGCFTPSSLDAPAGRGDSDHPLIDGLAEDDSGFARCEGRLLLTDLLSSLSARDQQILHYRYVEGWTQERIAEQMGVSQMQVSRILSRILRDLHAGAAA